MYFVDRIELDPPLMYADEDSLTYDGTIEPGKTIDDLIPSLAGNDKYKGDFRVNDGVLVYKGFDVDKQTWPPEIDIAVVSEGQPQVDISTPDVATVVAGEDVIYTVTFTSNSAITISQKQQI